MVAQSLLDTIRLFWYAYLHYLAFNVNSVKKDANHLVFATMCIGMGQGIEP